MVAMLSLPQRGAAYSIRRQLGTAFRNPAPYTAALRLSRSSLTDRRPRFFSLDARKRDPNDSYSVDDLAARARNSNERPMPPVLDSQDEDEGYGAYDYVPDVYDLQDMTQQDTLPDAFVEESPPQPVSPTMVRDDDMRKVTKKPTVRKVTKKPTIRAPVSAPVEEPVEVMELAAIVEEEAVDQPKEPTKPRSRYSPPPRSAVVEEEAVDQPKEPTTPRSRYSPPPRSEMMSAPVPADKPKETTAFRSRYPPRSEMMMAPAASPTPADGSKEPTTPRSRYGPPPRSEMMTATATHFHAARVVTGTMDGYLEKAAYGQGATNELDSIKQQMADLEKEIYLENKEVEFNINSPIQVSIVLYGYSGESTNKDVLEAMGGAGNRIADLILKYRTLKSSVKRMERKQTNKENKTHVVSAMTVARPNETQEEADPLMLLDASAYIFRAYYSMPPTHRADGMPTGAVMGFCNMLNRLILNRMVSGERPRLVLVFDSPGKTFRHDIYPEYKGNRKAAPMDLIPQFDLIRDAATAYGIPQIEAPTFEADDVIATLATMALEEGVDANILSGDKDLLQLVTGKDEVPSVHIIDPMTMSRVTYDQVFEKWGVGPEDLGDVLGLAGDSADNIPGVPGIGPKIAATLISEYGSLDKLLEQVDSVKQKARREKLKANADQARLSRVLVELERKVPMEMMTFPEGMAKAAELRMEAFDSDRLLKFYDQMSFRDLKRRVEGRLKQDGPTRSPPSLEQDGPTRSPPSRSSPPARSSYTKRPKTDIPRPEDYADVPF
jgi:5'-3' exonuclease